MIEKNKTIDKGLYVAQLRKNEVIQQKDPIRKG